MKDEFDDQIAWHPGFVAAASLELRDEPDLELISEYNLSKEPLRIDLYVRKQRDKPVKNEIGKHFRRYNVIEYKSPADGLSVDDFFKIIGYACLLKGLGEQVNSYPEDEITVSLFRSAYPRELFRYLRQTGRKIENLYDGIYYITGNVQFPVQVVVMSQLKAVHVGMRILSRNARQEDVERFILEMKDAENPGDKLNADAILQVSISANRELFRKMKEDSVMCKALEELMSDVIEEKAKKAALEAAVKATQSSVLSSIQAIMENLRYTAEQAMDILNIAEKDRAFYLTKL